MLSNNPLLILPILRRSYDQYYTDHNKLVAEKKAKFRKANAKPLESFSKGLQVNFEERLFWPPWFFNDTIGFLEIGTDGGKYLFGVIYLKRKHFHRDSHEREYKQYDTTLQKQQILYHSEVQRYPITLLDNASYTKAASKIICEAQKKLRKRFKKAEVWKPGYDLACIDLAKADALLTSPAKQM